MIIRQPALELRCAETVYTHLEKAVMIATRTVMMVVLQLVLLNKDGLAIILLDLAAHACGDGYVVGSEV